MTTSNDANSPSDPSIPAGGSIPVVPLGDIITAISDRTRWHIFDELIKGEPLPVIEIARRLGAPPRTSRST